MQICNWLHTSLQVTGSSLPQHHVSNAHSGSNAAAATTTRLTLYNNFEGWLCLQGTYMVEGTAVLWWYLSVVGGGTSQSRGINCMKESGGTSADGITLGWKWPILYYRSLRCQATDGKRRAHISLDFVVLWGLHVRKSLASTITVIYLGGQEHMHMRHMDVTVCSERGCVDLFQIYIRMRSTQ